MSGFASTYACIKVNANTGGDIMEDRIAKMERDIEMLKRVVADLEEEIEYIKDKLDKVIE